MALQFPSQEKEVSQLLSIFEYAKNEDLGDQPEYVILDVPSGIELKVDEMCDSLSACIEMPRNEIDNPIRYCAMPFHAIASTSVVLDAIEKVPRQYGIPGHEFLWSLFVRFTAKTVTATKTGNNIPEGGWEWYHFDLPPASDYIVAYLKGLVSAERAIALSGLSETKFAQIVQEKAMERDLPIFRDYLKGKSVRDRLPFSEEKSAEFRDLMAEDLE